METTFFPVARVGQFVRWVEESPESKYFIVLPLTFIISTIGIKHLALTLLDSVQNLTIVFGTILFVLNLFNLSHNLIVLAEGKLNHFRVC